MDLSNSTILITGGSSGIGLELAGRFLQKKNKVIINHNGTCLRPEGPIPFL